MRTVEYIFRSIKSVQDFVITVRFSVIEIYNDTVMDLLRDSLHDSQNDSPKLVIVDTPNGVIIPALYLLPIENEEEAFAKLYEANLNRSLSPSLSCASLSPLSATLRSVAEHQLNRRSSRSHAIYSFYITRSRSDSASAALGSDVSDSKLHLVDLAGSERIEKTGSTGGLIKEATHINKSLSFLEQVVLSLTKKAQASATIGATQTKKDFIPAYRQSKLTYILKDSLGGNCNT
jgi:kinesin family member 6/9